VHLGGLGLLKVLSNSLGDLSTSRQNTLSSLDVDSSESKEQLQLGSLGFGQTPSFVVRLFEQMFYKV